MDGKRRISIVIFLNWIQVISRMKHRKPENKAASQEQRFLIGFWRKTGKDNNPLSVKAPSAFNAVVMVVACIPTSICHSIEQRAPSRFHYDKMLSHPYKFRASRGNIVIPFISIGHTVKRCSKARRGKSRPSRSGLVFHAKT